LFSLDGRGLHAMLRGLETQQGAIAMRHALIDDVPAALGASHGRRTMHPLHGGRSA